MEAVPLTASQAPRRSGLYSTKPFPPFARVRPSQNEAVTNSTEIEESQ
jgi:hypothetical protein